MNAQWGVERPNEEEGYILFRQYPSRRNVYLASAICPLYPLIACCFHSVDEYSKWQLVVNISQMDIDSDMFRWLQECMTVGWSVMSKSIHVTRIPGL